jgi:DNA modification methylase
MTQALRDKRAMRSSRDIVLDPFLAIPTLMAAERTGRICRGVEIDPLYVDIAIRRWRRITGERAVHAESGIDLAALELEETGARHER